MINSRDSFNNNMSYYKDKIDTVKISLPSKIRVPGLKEIFEEKYKIQTISNIKFIKKIN